MALCLFMSIIKERMFSESNLQCILNRNSLTLIKNCVYSIFDSEIVSYIPFQWNVSLPQEVLIKVFRNFSKRNLLYTFKYYAFLFKTV